MLIVEALKTEFSFVKSDSDNLLDTQQGIHISSAKEIDEEMT